MTNFNSNEILLANSSKAHKLGNKLDEKIELLTDGLKENKGIQESFFIERTIWACVATYNDTGNNPEFWSSFASFTSEGTRKVTSSFIGRFKAINNDCSCTITSKEAINATYKNMVNTFKDLELDTMKAIKEYGKPLYELSDIAQKIASDTVKKSVAIDGFLSDDQEEKLLEDLLKVFEKHEKKNK